MICEKCKKQHNGKFATGRFCSRSCANSKIQTKEANEKRSKKLKGKRNRGALTYFKGEIEKVCPICNKTYIMKVAEPKQTCCKKDCINKLLSLRNNKNPRENKYLWTRKEGKVVRKHKIIMENILGRKLNNDEVIHHKNGIRNDNNVENLELLTKSEHTKLHKKIKT